MARFPFALLACLIFGSAADLRGADRYAAPLDHRIWAWQIEGPHAVIRIAGCLHLGTSRDARAYQRYLPIYRQSSSIYFETLPEAGNSFEMRRLVDRRGFLSDRQPLSSRISGETWQTLTNALRLHPEKLTSISKMEPWLAAFTLTQDSYAAAGLRSEDSLEAFLKHHAIEDRKAVGALESSKDQILALADAPRADQEDFLRATAAGLDKIGGQTEALRDAWLSGDEARLQSVLRSNVNPIRSALQQNLIGARNRRWVRKILEIEKTGSNALVVVGIEHLVAASDALPDLLRQSGLQVRPLNGGR